MIKTCEDEAASYWQYTENSGLCSKSLHRIVNRVVAGSSPVYLQMRVVAQSVEH